MAEIVYYESANETLTEEQKQKIASRLNTFLDKHPEFKKVEVATIGEIYYDPKWKSSKKIPLTTMHVARFMKR